MKCPYCKLTVEKGYAICPRCGTDLVQHLENDHKRRDNVLLIWMCIFGATSIITALFYLLVPNWYSISDLRVVINILHIIGNLSFILIPFAFKKLELRIVAFIVFGLLILYWVTSNIIGMFL